MIRILNLVLYSFFLMCLPLKAQNMASVEAIFPLGVSFVYGIDYHPKWYTQLKPNVVPSFGGGSSGNWFSATYGLAIEQRYYYNMLKRQEQGKKTVHKSANYFSVKSAYGYSHYLKHYLDEAYDWHICTLTVNWGLRRAFGKRFYFDGSISAGFSYNTYDTHYGSIAHSLGYYTPSEHHWQPLFGIDLSIGYKLF